MNGLGSTVRREGYGYELWPVIAIPGGPSRYDELLQRLGRTDEVPVALPPIAERAAGGIVYHSDDGRWLRMPGGEGANPLDSFAETFGHTATEIAPVASLATAVFGLSEDEIDALESTTTLDWLGQFNLPAGPLAYVGVMLNMFFLIGPDRIPASEAIRIYLRGFMLAGGAFQYFKGGIGRPLEVAADYVTAQGAWPTLGDHLVRTEAYTTRNVSHATRDAVVPGAGGECIGIAQTMEQEGRSKPNPRTPLAGLYIVGCDAGGKGVATHQAVDSGFRVADLVLADLGVR